VNAGVSGFLHMDAGVEEFVGTVRSVAAGAMVLPPSMAPTLFAEIAKDRGARTSGPGRRDPCLTPREYDVMSLIGAGLCNKDIAGRLNIATHTVKTHVRNILGKLALRTRLQVAAVYANRHRPI
jgi:DNA-binding NarL/FixJ family response regulator